MIFQRLMADRASALYQGIVCFLIFVMTCCIFVPFHPVMPQFGTDPSWIFSLNQALAQGLHFGRDILFTCGPYIAVAAHMYQPETFLFTLICCVYLACCYGLNLTLFAISAPRFAIWMLLPLLFSQSIDVRFFMYELLIVLNCMQYFYAERFMRAPLWAQNVLLAVLLSPFGLLALADSNSKCNTMTK